MPILTPAIFSRSYIEIGSGTCLEPLLRFSDVFKDFLFVDCGLSIQEARSHLEAALIQIRGPNAPNEATPLIVTNITHHRHLGFADFEFAVPPNQVNARLHEVLGGLGWRSSLEEEAHHAGPEQWAIVASLVRHIKHVDGTCERRPLTLRLVCGEGVTTYVAMGGLDAPPKWVSTIQTGPGEEHGGPLARLLRRQHLRRKPLPRVWLRGATPERRLEVLEESWPFTKQAQAFGDWLSDRSFPYAADRQRFARAWITRPGPQFNEVRLGPHRLTPSRITQALVEAADTAALPASLAVRLGVAAAPDVLLWPAGQSRRRGMAEQLRSWQATHAFKHARAGVMIPGGSEDEMAVLIRWLSSISSPAITVHLPMPLDFEAAERALQLGLFRAA